VTLLVIGHLSGLGWSVVPHERAAVVYHPVPYHRSAVARGSISQLRGVCAAKISS
jgi:hypothetical protein